MNPKKYLDTKSNDEIANDEEFGVFNVVKNSYTLEEETSFVNEVVTNRSEMNILKIVRNQIFIYQLMLSI